MKKSDYGIMAEEKRYNLTHKENVSVQNPGFGWVTLDREGRLVRFFENNGSYIPLFREWREGRVFLKEKKSSEIVLDTIEWSKLIPLLKNEMKDVREIRWYQPDGSFIYFSVEL